MLGLFHRARRLLLESGRLQRQVGNKLGLLTNAWNLFATEHQMRHPDAARTAADAAVLTREIGAPRFAGNPSYAAGMIAMLEGRAAEAAAHFDRAVEELGTADEGNRMEFLTQSARAHLAAGQPTEALAASRRATELHRAKGYGMVDGSDPPALWWWHREALRANGKAAEAREALARAYRIVLDFLPGLATRGCAAMRSTRRPKSVPSSAPGSLPRTASCRKAKREAHLAGAANLREPFERLVDTGLRLNELRSAEELQTFLVDEATELTGAERLLLVLESPDGPRIAGSLVPEGEVRKRCCKPLFHHWTKSAARVPSVWPDT